MTEWIVCSECGKEHPWTFYSLSLDGSERSTVCKACVRRERHRVEWRKRDRSGRVSPRYWRQDEVELVADGESVIDIASKTGRSSEAVVNKAKRLGYDVYGGRIHAKGQ